MRIEKDYEELLKLFNRRVAQKCHFAQMTADEKIQD
jgi:hypothetical protein